MNSLPDGDADVDVVHAELRHVDGVKRLLDANRDTFGFVVRTAVEESHRAGELPVALSEGGVCGFVRYHHRRRDLVTSLYEICVGERQRGLGVGALLLSHLVRECEVHGRSRIALMCPMRALANGFYARFGFVFDGTVIGRRRVLNIWRLDLLRVTV